MGITVEYLVSAGYSLKAAPADDWRIYDEENPVPAYYDFDWFSAYHPDLYHRFALSTDGLMDELEQLVDLSDLVVADIGAGTGRATVRAAEKAARVYAIDIYESVVDFGSNLIHELVLTNVEYILGDSAAIPLPENSVDASICAWAVLNHEEAHRVLKPGGLLAYLGPAPGSACGELTATLAGEYPRSVFSVGSVELFDPQCPPSEGELDSWGDVPLTAPAKFHDFTYVSDYGNCDDAAAILGRLYGPKAKNYILNRAQSTLSWRLRITVARVAK